MKKFNVTGLCVPKKHYMVDGYITIDAKGKANVSNKIFESVLIRHFYDSAHNDLVVITFDKPDKAWLDFVCLNRSGREYPGHYDIAYGPVANDQVFTVVSLYEQGVLSEETALMEMKVRELYNQILFHTANSLKYCDYVRHRQVREYK